VNNFQYSQYGLDITESFEGLRLNAYKDVAGVVTIGYGHTGSDVSMGWTITPEQAQTLLQSDIAASAACVNSAVTPSINQNQFDALVDFTFNVGRGSFLRSTLLVKINSGDFPGAANQFVWSDSDGKLHGWIYAGGEINAGLVRRRDAEKALFLQEVSA